MRVDLETLLTDSWLKKNRLAPLSNVPTEKGWNYKFKEKQRRIQCKTFSRTSRAINFSFFSLKNRLSTLLIRSWATMLISDILTLFFLLFPGNECLMRGKQTSENNYDHISSFSYNCLSHSLALFNLFVFVRESCCICICVVLIFVFAFVFVFFTSWNEVEGESAYHPHWCSP